MDSDEKPDRHLCIIVTSPFFYLGRRACKVTIPLVSFTGLLFFWGGGIGFWDPGGSFFEKFVTSHVYKKYFSSKIKMSVTRKSLLILEKFNVN